MRIKLDNTKKKTKNLTQCLAAIIQGSQSFIFVGVFVFTFPTLVFAIFSQTSIFSGHIHLFTVTRQYLVISYHLLGPAQEDEADLIEKCLKEL